MRRLFVMLIFIVFLSPSLLLAQKPESTGELPTAEKPPAASSFEKGIDMKGLGGVLLKFLVLSVIFESALTPIFNWRWFARWLNGYGVKTPITIGLAFLASQYLQIDQVLITDLLKSANIDIKAESSLASQAITALLIAGGNDGIYRIFDKIGIRDSVARNLMVARLKSQKSRHSEG